MKMPFPIAVFSLFIAHFYPQWCGLAAAGASARLVDWAHVIVDGRRGDDQSCVRQDKDPAPSASVADGKPLSAHRFSGGWIVPSAMPWCQTSGNTLIFLNIFNTII